MRTRVIARLPGPRRTRRGSALVAGARRARTARAPPRGARARPRSSSSSRSRESGACSSLFTMPRVSASTARGRLRLERDAGEPALELARRIASARARSARIVGTAASAREPALEALLLLLHDRLGALDLALPLRARWPRPRARGRRDRRGRRCRAGPRPDRRCAARRCRWRRAGGGRARAAPLARSSRRRAADGRRRCR